MSLIDDINNRILNREKTGIVYYHCNICGNNSYPTKKPYKLPKKCPKCKRESENLIVMERL